MRMQSFGPGGQDESLPYNNLIEIVDVDDETHEKTVYYPPFEDVPPVEEPPEVEPQTKEAHKKSRGKS